MAQFIIHGLSGVRCVQYQNASGGEGDVTWLRSEIEAIEGIPAMHQRLTLSELSGGDVSGVKTWIVRLGLRIEGGKGGFGTLLRGTGQNRQGPVNNDSSRDLDGRRLRDATALAKIERALERKEAALNGIILPESDDEQEEQKNRKRKPKRKSTRTPANDDETTSNIHEQAKLEAKRRKQERIGQIHREVVEETAEAVEIGFEAHSDKTAKQSSNTRSKSVGDMYGDIYAVESSSEEEEESDESEEESESAQDDQLATASHPEPSKPVDLPITKKKEEEIVEPTSERESNGVKRPHDEMTKQELVDLMKYNSAKELEGLGLDRLKEELIAREMLSGGDLVQRASRLFLVRGLSRHEYPANVLAKSKKPKT